MSPERTLRPRRARLFIAAAASGLLAALPAAAGSLDAAQLKARAGALAESFDGKVGFCARTESQLVCVKGDRAFPMQSVVKLLVAVAVMDRVDQGRLKLSDTILMTADDRSVCVQPTAEKAVAHGPYRASIDDLMTSMLVDSDCAAMDRLVADLGGPAAVQSVLSAKGLAGVRIDRDERSLQTEIDGLAWRAAYADPAALKRAEAAVPAARRQAAFDAYLKDPRDRATPAGMTLLLQRLAEGQLLSPASTAHLLGVMAQTRTGPDRLKAGLGAGWRLAHKTGTSGVHEGVSAALNDVGVLTAPDGGKVMVAAFVSETRASAEQQARLIAGLARAVVESYVPAGR